MFETVLICSGNLLIIWKATMAVYVDNMRARFGRLILCHMVADTLYELHEMADRIGVSRRWFQDGASLPHYDICLSKRALALRAGAQTIDRAELVRRIRAHRAKEGR